jgi:hypothetical protein
MPAVLPKRRNSETRAPNAALPPWPKGANPIEWLVCTAAWATLLPPGSKNRCYAQFALRELLGLRLLAEARHCCNGLLSGRTDTNAFEGDSENDVLIGALVLLGELAAARAALVQFLRSSLAHPRKSYRQYGITRTFELLAANGAKGVGKPTDFRMEKQRIAHLEQLLADPTLKLSRRAPTLPKRKPEVLPSEKAALKKGKAALKELNPSEWNLHNGAGDLCQAVLDLVRINAQVQAADLLDCALSTFASGKLDSRGFASGAAYIEIARAVHAARGPLPAIPLLEKAAQVCGKADLKIVQRSLAEAYRDFGHLHTALSLARHIAKGEGRDALLIELLFRASRLPGGHKKADALTYETELQAMLAAVTEPESAARCAWAIAYELVPDLHVWP